LADVALSTGGWTKYSAGRLEDDILRSRVHGYKHIRSSHEDLFLFLCSEIVNLLSVEESILL
jgi:hypothetical protein